MLHSMTGFAAGTGAAQGWSWSWDMRSVNGRGLDVKLRMPDWIDGLEAAVRARVKQAAARGNITLGLRLTREEGGTAPTRLDADALGAVLDRLAEVETAALARGLALAPTTATEILSTRGVQDVQASEPEDHAPLRAALLADLDLIIARFEQARAAEGDEIGRHIGARIDEIAGLTARAVQQAEERGRDLHRLMQAALERALGACPQADPDRLEQELALIAVKIDVSEEIERLETHTRAAVALLAEGGPVGRKLDFLTQEFNREANTLCAKAQHAALTQTGLDLKTAIDQMREQVQNLE